MQGIFLVVLTGINNMKINELTEERQQLILNMVYIDVNCDGNIVYDDCRDIIPDAHLNKLFKSFNI